MRYTSKENSGILDYCIPNWKTVLLGFSLIGFITGYYQKDEPKTINVSTPTGYEILKVSDDKPDCDKDGNCRARLF